MTDRGDMGGRPPGRPPAEGVRIIRAEEAQAALDAGEATGRRPDDQPRYGDVPPAPSGPRPAHRFPLPDSVDPADAVALPPLTPASRPPYTSQTESVEPESWELAGSAEESEADQFPPRLGVSESVAGPFGSAEEPGNRVPGDTYQPDENYRPADTYRPRETYAPDDSYRRDDSYRPGDDPYPRPEGTYRQEDAGTGQESWIGQPDEGFAVIGSTDLPHWSDPPTGEVPAILMGDPGTEGEVDTRGGTGAARWRDGEAGWDDLDEISDLAGDDQPIGALDQSRAAHSDIYSFDEDFERVTSRSPEPSEGAFDQETHGDADEAAWVAPAAAGAARGATRAETRAAAKGSRPSSRKVPSVTSRGGDIGSRVAVGIVLLAALIVAYAIGSKVLLVLTAVVVVAAVAEGYGMLQRAGFRPATLLALAGTAGLIFGAYWKGTEAIPIVLVLTFVGSMLWYILGIVEARPLANVAVTVMVFVWVAVLGSFAPVMLRAANGKGLFLGTVIVAVVADVSAFLVGRSLGSRPLAESISPGKTIEGFFGGLVGALIAGAIVGKEITPWAGMKHGLLLGLVIGIVAPLGDLFESMIKRDLGVKDFGTALAGHGGVLDRFDSMLLALPAAYFVATLFHLVKV